jgi:hypothetical protein
MKKVLLILLLGTQVVLWGHLCNDVFRQASSSLAIKVDTRDGQLRINQAGTFRVYLQNGMDRDIERIGLRVRAKGFSAIARPSNNWRLFPTLMSLSNGGRREYFEVTLTRKPGVLQGKHTLKLFVTCGGRVLKSYKVGMPAEKMVIPLRSPMLIIDGSVNVTEWGNTKPCTSFYEIRKRKKKNSHIQTRVRFSRDQQALYCLVDFQKKGNLDQVNLYISEDQSAEPVNVSIDLQAASVSCSPQIPGNERIQAAVNPGGTKMEIRLPFKLLQLTGQSHFFLNMTRKQDDRMTYWRGEVKNVSDPSIFEEFELQ